MASKVNMSHASAGDILLAIHDFSARSPDELTLSRGDRIELIERDDDFGDGWFLGKHLALGTTGLFPEVYTTPAPKGIHSSTAVRKPTTSTAAPGSNGTSVAGAQNESQASSQRPSTPKASDQSLSSKSVRASDSSIPSQMQSADTPSPATQRSSLPTSGQRNMPASSYTGDVITSPVMNETLSVIEEHMTEMNSPRQSSASRISRLHDGTNDYRSRVHQIDHINGEETDEEENGKLTQAEVLTWSPERVAEYLEDLGVDKNHCEVFQEQEISGDVLLSMDQSSVFLKEFQLGPVGRRLKTWHKIRQLQMDVGSTTRAGNRSASGYSTAGASVSDHGRDRSASAAAALPRVPSLSETQGMEAGRTHTLTSHSPQPLFQTDSEAPLGASRTVRPSAQSIRSLNHRRHSSIDALETPSKSPLPPTVQSASPTGTSHKSQGSFDRSWTMGAGHRSTVSTGSASGRPLSTVHQHTVSSDKIPSNPYLHDNYTLVNAIDLDRGYFSGTEAETRRVDRNVLQKKGREGSASAQHSRNTSFSAVFKRRSGSATHIRGGSGDSTNDSVGPMTSPTKYSSRFKQPKRSASGPEARSSTVSHDYPPTVTKLEYGATHSIDAVAASPNPIDSETSSLDKNSLGSPPSSMSTVFRKNRLTGLRAISDAVVGSEKNMAVSPTDVSKDSMSPLYSPARTGSSTPSGTSRSLDIDDPAAGIAKTSTTSSTGTHTPVLTPAPIGAPPRRKTKRGTSAYTRGLLKKTPQEQMQDCDYSGWMKKKSSNVMATWKPRLFVLRGRRLSYYYSDHDIEEKGLIDISNHRVLPANDEKLVGLHATITGATASPTSPQNSTTPTSAAADAAKMTLGDTTPAGIFIFKLVPPREGLSKAVNFTKPTVHYFAVDNLAEGRLWMAALMKATIDRDDSTRVVTTYNQPTISLAKARAMKHRPPALMTDDSSIGGGGSTTPETDDKGLGLSLDRKSAENGEPGGENRRASGGGAAAGDTLDLKDFLKREIAASSLAS